MEIKLIQLQRFWQVIKLLKKMKISVKYQGHCNDNKIDGLTNPCKLIKCFLIA